MCGSAGSVGKAEFSIVIVNWNGRHLLEECIESVLSQQDGSLEVIVVDNGSRDASVQWMQQRYQGSIRIIGLFSNEGWAGGNNQGIEAATGEYLLLLNNDACLGAGFFDRLREGIRRHPAAGMYTPRILNYYDRSLLDNAGQVIYRDGTARGRGRSERNDARFDREEEVLCPSGAAGIYRREIFDRVGLIDGRYFAYGEDTELGLRARRAGFTCFYVPGAIVYHKYSASGGAYSPQKVYWVERNRIWTIVKTFPWFLVLVSPVFTVLRYALGLYGLLSHKGSVGRFSEVYPARDLLLAVARAYLDGVKGIPEMLRKRNLLRANQVVVDREFTSMLRTFRAGVREVAFRE